MAPARRALPPRGPGGKFISQSSSKKPDPPPNESPTCNTDTPNSSILSSLPGSLTTSAFPSLFVESKNLDPSNNDPPPLSPSNSELNIENLLTFPPVTPTTALSPSLTNPLPAAPPPAVPPPAHGK
ncbi:hypothetical protein BJV78DRAFT_1364234 [Lactifluus subvellereus]|nr:hypothetical protein BJV78DRAFT_1364234 [Lactifluus subvellereus]